LGLAVAALALCACAENPHHLNTTYLDRYADPDPTPGNFHQCHGFNCTHKTPVHLSTKEWRQVAAIFAPHAKDAKAERQQIARAVMLMQTLVGQQTGTAVHQWTHKNMLVLPNLGDRTQLDCIDESVNAWTYMTMMERSRLFRFHRVAKLAYAGYNGDLDPRNTAVMEEISGGYFAIDPSIVDYGESPPVMPLATWLAPWPPNISEIETPASSRG
jgi:hypothetical protein